MFLNSKKLFFLKNNMIWKWYSKCFHVQNQGDRIGLQLYQAELNPRWSFNYSPHTRPKLTDSDLQRLKKRRKINIWREKIRVGIGRAKDFPPMLFPWREKLSLNWFLKTQFTRSPRNFWKEILNLNSKKPNWEQKEWFGEFSIFWVSLISFNSFPRRNSKWTKIF